MEKSQEFFERKKAVLDDLKRLLREKAILLATLEMWHDVELGGIDPNQVKSLGFDPEKLHHGPLKQHWKYVRGRVQGSSEVFYVRVEGQAQPRCRWYNLATLQDDGVQVVLEKAVMCPEDRLDDEFARRVARAVLPLPRRFGPWRWKDMEDLPPPVADDQLQLCTRY